MRKNIASQVVSFQAISSADGSDVTSGTPVVYYTVNGGTQGTGGGTTTHEGNGQWSYVPLQAETNGDQVAFTFVLSGAISQTVNVWPVAFNPTAADLGAPAVTLAATATSAQLVDDILDEDVTGHTTNNTLGKIIKGISEGWVADEGSVNDASATTTSFISDLTQATNSFFSDATVVFITGVLKGQSRLVSNYDGTTKAFTFDEAFTSAPANTTEFIVLAQHNHTIASIIAAIDADSTQLAAILLDTAALTNPAGITKNAVFDNFEFPMVLTSDHYTAATGKTVTGEMSIDGAAYAVVNGIIAEVGSGTYQIDFTAADTNGDTITYKFSATACDDTFVTVITRS